MKTTGIKVIQNVIWRFGERISAQIITFIVSIILARIISPADYGAMAIIIVFINFANVLVNNGFATALIQKKDADNIDFSSVFYFTLCASILLYAVLFLSAPLIASWYSMPVLKSTLRVIGIRIIIGAVNAVQQSYVARHMMFKRFFWSTLSGTICSAIVGIMLAYSGFGIWALVMQYIINTTVDTFVLWFTVKWRPILAFSLFRLKSLFSYGWKLLASALLGSIYEDLRSLIIGKLYPPENLAFFTKGAQIPNLIMRNVNVSVSSVSLPVLSQYQDNLPALAKQNKKIIDMLVFVISPLLLGLSSVATPLVSVLLTDKWLPCVIYVRLWCIFFLINSIFCAYLQCFKALGKSGLSLIIELIDDIIGIILIGLLFRSGIAVILIISIVSRTIALISSMAVYRNIFSITLFDQIKDFCKPIAVSIGIFFIVYYIGELALNKYLLLSVQTLFGALSYFTICYALKMPQLDFILMHLKQLFIKLASS